MPHRKGFVPPNTFEDNVKVTNRRAWVEMWIRKFQDGICKDIKLLAIDSDDCVVEYHYKGQRGDEIVCFSVNGNGRTVSLEQVLDWHSAHRLQVLWIPNGHEI